MLAIQAIPFDLPMIPILSEDLAFILIFDLGALNLRVDWGYVSIICAVAFWSINSKDACAYT